MDGQVADMHSRAGSGWCGLLKTHGYIPGNESDQMEHALTDDLSMGLHQRSLVLPNNSVLDKQYLFVVFILPLPLVHFISSRRNLFQCCCNVMIVDMIRPRILKQILKKHLVPGDTLDRQKQVTLK